MTQRLAPRFSIHKKWLVIFALWLAFLSGTFVRFIGSPGILQAVRLNSLLDSKTKLLSQVQEDSEKLKLEAGLLEKSRSEQRREIRKVLGYAAHDEIVFDFSQNDQF